MNGCDRYGTMVAARAFDALEPAEAQAFDAHLASCPACREALTACETLPILLDLAGGVDTQIPAPSPLLEASVVAGVGALSPPRRRRRSTPGRRTAPQRRPAHGSARRARRPALVLAAVLALLVLTGALIAGPLAGERQPAALRASVSVRMLGSGAEPGAAATATLRYRRWGTAVDLQVSHLAPTRGEEIYELWFVAPQGRLSAGTFTVGATGRAQVTLAAAAHPGHYRMLGITLEPDGIHPGRHGPNILRAPLPA
ncbi:MAG TPA: anti-sigma factor [Solirubrobacteraceae bacterium]|nr:anti-sigma factor [Solirubrobacteraceae bacterium]